MSAKRAHRERPKKTILRRYVAGGFLDKGTELYWRDITCKTLSRDPTGTNTHSYFLLHQPHINQPCHFDEHAGGCAIG
jgi:hypothetical protein